MRTQGTYKGGFIWRCTRYSKQVSLKILINDRLRTEDYTCRLPKPPKPRVRYKLTTSLAGSWDGVRESWVRVWH